PEKEAASPDPASTNPAGQIAPPREIRKSLFRSYVPLTFALPFLGLCLVGMLTCDISVGFAERCFFVCLMSLCLSFGTHVVIWGFTRSPGEEEEQFNARLKRAHRAATRKTKLPPDNVTRSQGVYPDQDGDRGTDESPTTDPDTTSKKEPGPDREP